MYLQNATNRRTMKFNIHDKVRDPNKKWVRGIVVNHFVNSWGEIFYDIYNDERKQHYYWKENNLILQLNHPAPRFEIGDTIINSKLTLPKEGKIVRIVAHDEFMALQYYIQYDNGTQESFYDNVDGGLKLVKHTTNDRWILEIHVYNNDGSLQTSFKYKYLTCQQASRINPKFDKGTNFTIEFYPMEQ